MTHFLAVAFIFVLSQSSPPATDLGTLLPYTTIVGGLSAAVGMLWKALNKERDKIDQVIPLVVQVTMLLPAVTDALTAVSERTPTREQYERLIKALDDAQRELEGIRRRRSSA